MRLLRSKTLLLGTLLFALVAVGIASTRSRSGAAQERAQPPPGTIRVRVNLVPVDVVVTDRNHKPVLDLRREDFTLLEDGRAQEIRHFSVQDLKPEPSPSETRLLLRKIPTLELLPQSSRVFLILLGRGRHQTPFKGVDALIRFVDEDLLPQDRVAVFAYNRATDFTSDHHRIVDVLRRYKDIHERIETRAELRFSGLAAVYGTLELPKSWQPDIDEIFGDAGARQVPPGRITTEGKIAEDVLNVTENMMLDETRYGARERLRVPLTAGPTGGGSRDPHLFERMETGMLTDLPFGEYASTSASTHQDLQSIFTAIEYLRYAEGEKHLLYFTAKGLFLPRLEYDRSIAAMANDARVAIDTFETGGLSPFTPSREFSQTAGMPVPGIDDGYGDSGPKSSWSQSMALSSLRNVSDLTGGHSSIHADVGKALASLNETTRTEYLVGYYPERAVWDGGYRHITVRVKRPALNVQYRHGYYARDVLQPYDREEFLAYSRLSSAAAYGSEIEDISFKVKTAWQRDNTGKKQTRLDLAIDASKIKFRMSDGRYVARLRVAIFYTDSDNRYLGDIWESLDMNLREETYAKVLREGIPYSTLLPLALARRTLKVVAYDLGGDRVGSVVHRIR